MGTLPVLAAATTREGAIVYLAVHLVAFSIWARLGRKHFPLLVTVLLLFAALINGAGWAFGLLDRVKHYDKFAHWFCTFAIVLPVAISLWRRRPGAFDRVLVLATIGAGLGGGVVWEWWEWLFDQVGRGAHSMSLEDTLGDLFFGFLGTLTAALVARWLTRRRPLVLPASVSHAPPSPA